MHAILHACTYVLGNAASPIRFSHLVSPSHSTLRTGYEKPRLEGLSHPPPRAEAGPRFPVRVTDTAVNARLTRLTRLTRAHASSYPGVLLSKLDSY
ncbi:hypothetical protein I7I48_11047 [Histoplasma ohiense]|nr:hypothetical protein I7I48_11047 [Histoplasma ohiense (nom. inval.)]